MAVLDFMPSPAAVIAESNCEAIEVPNHTLRRLFQREVEQYAISMMNLGREVSRGLRIPEKCLFQLRRGSD